MAHIRAERGIGTLVTIVSLIVVTGCTETAFMAEAQPVLDSISID